MGRKRAEGFVPVVLAALWGCGGAPAAVQAPDGAKPMPVVAIASPAGPDLGAVPAPKTLVLSGRVAKPSALLSLANAWSGQSMPQSEDLTELLVGAKVGPLVDLDLPIDLAVTVAGSGARMRPVVAVSVALRDADAAKAALADRYKLVPGAHGALLIKGAGSSSHKGASDKGDTQDEGPDDADSDRACELAPAFGKAPVRLVCGDSVKALAELGPWLTRTATRATSSSDLHADIHLQPLHSIVTEQRRALGLLVAALVDGGPGVSAVRELMTAVLGDAADLATDLDTIAVDVGIDETGINTALDVRLSGSTSTFGRIATAHPDRNGPPPAAFLQLPADADFAAFYRGTDDADLARARGPVLRALGAVLADGGVKESDRAPVLAALEKLVSGAPMAYAGGVDGAGLARAVAAQKALGDHAGPAAVRSAARARAEALLGWRLIALDEPAAKAGGALNDLASAWSRPGLAAYRAKNPHLPLPTFRVAAGAKGAGAPVGLQHWVLEISPMRPEASPSPGAAAKSRADAAKPLLLHVMAVGDTSRTWIGIGIDEKLVTAKLVAMLGGHGDSLGSRADLASWNATAIGSGGFFTQRALVENAAGVDMLGGDSSYAGDDDIISSTFAEGRGRTPVFVSTSPESGPPEVGLLLRLQVPAASIKDAVDAVAAMAGGN